MQNVPLLTAIERRFYEHHGEHYCRAHERWHCDICFELAKSSENQQLVVERIETASSVRPGVWVFVAAMLTAITLTGLFH